MLQLYKYPWMMYRFHNLLIQFNFGRYKHVLITAKRGICYPWYLKYFHFRRIQLNFDYAFNDYESRKLCNYYISKLVTNYSTQLSIPYHLIKLNISEFVFFHSFAFMLNVNFKTNTLNTLNHVIWDFFLF